jgi:hypothetical protein
VRVTRNARRTGTAGQVPEAGRQVLRRGPDPAGLIQAVQPQRRQHLIVPRPRRVDFLPELAELLREPVLDGGVAVLHLPRNRKASLLRQPGDGVQLLHEAPYLVGLQHADPAEHFRVPGRGCAVVPDEPQIKHGIVTRREGLNVRVGFRLFLPEFHHADLSVRETARIGSSILSRSVYM